MSNEKPSKRRWLRWLVWLGAGVLLILAVAITGLVLYFNDAYFLARLKEVVRTELGRELEMRALHVSFWNGAVSLEGVRLLNAADSFKDKDSLRIERASINIAPWPLIRSGLKKVEGLSIQLEKPEVIVECSGTWPNVVSNIDDLIQKLLAGPPGVWPKQTGLQALNATLAVHGGSVSYQDCEERVGVSRIKDLEVDASQPALGEPARVKASFNLNTPHAPPEGTASLEGQIRWLEADGSINPSAFAAITVSGQLKELDVAQVARHLRKRWSVLDGQYRLTMGRPVSGTLKLEAPTLAQAHVTAEMESDGAVGVWQEHKRVAGNVPGRVEVNAKGGWSGGALQLGETHLGLVFAGSRAALSGPQAARLLDLEIDVPPAQAEAKYAVVLDARLDELFATDVGAVLGLRDKIGGKLAMKIDAKRDAGGRMQAEGKLSTSEGYVAVGNVRQPTKLDVGFSANVLPDAQGRPERAEVNFSANADSFYVKSERPAAITSLNEPRKLAAEAQLKLHVGGNEFWKQFGPLLKVANMSAPLAEELDGQLQVGGSAGKVQLQLDCTLQQQNSSPTPIRLVAKGDYDGAALVDVPTSPYLSFDVQVKSADKSLSLQLAGTATRGKDKQVVNLAKFEALGDLKAFNAFNARFGAYVPVLFGPQYTASGSIKETGTSQSVQTLAADGKVTSTTLNLATDVQLSSFDLSGPSLAPNAPPLHWTESDATLALEMSVADSDAGTTLSLKRATLRSTGLNLDGEMADADLARLKAAAAPNATPLKLWLEALPFTKLNVKSTAATLQKLQALGILPAEPLAAGDLALTAQHDPKTRRLKIELLSFENQTLSVKLVPTELDLSALAAAAGDKTISAAKLAQALPALDLTATCKDEILPRLQTRLGLPSEPLASGLLTLSAGYDPKTRNAALRSLAFAGPDLNLKAAAPEIDVVALAALADQPKLTGAQWLQAAPAFSFEVDAKPAAIQRLQKLKVLPPDPALAGALALRGSLDRAARIMKVESSTFNGALGDLSLIGLALSTDKLGAFIDGPQKDIAAAAQLLPDFQLDLKAKAPLFEFLQARRMLPDDLGLSGTLNVKARFVQAADRLVIENLEFARAAGAGVPVISLLASGELAAVRSLIGGAPADPMKALAQFDKGLTVKKLQGDLGSLLSFLKRKDIAAPMAQDFQDGVYRAPGPLTVQDLVLRPAGAPGVFDVTLNLEAPLEWHPRPGAGLPPAAEPALAMSGAWVVDAAAPLRLNLNRGQFSAQGTLNLNAAGLRYVVDKTYFTYNKPAGTPCTLKLDVSLRDDNMARAPAIALTGGPLNLALANLVYNTATPKAALSLDKLTLSTDLLSVTLSALQLDLNKDSLHLQISSESLDVGKLAALGAQLPPHFQVGGTLNNVQASYDGLFSAFPKTLTASTAANLRLAGTAPGQNVTLTLAGNLNADQNSISARDKGLAVTLEYPQAKARSVQALQVPLQVTSRNPGVGVLEALQKPGLPILVKVQAAQVQELDVAVLSEGLSALANAASPAPSSSGPSDMSGISELRAELAASAQKVWISDGMQLLNTQLPSLVFDRLTLTINDAKIDLNMPPAGGKKENYQVQSQLGLSVALARERDLKRVAKDELRNWKGDVKAQVNGLVAHKEAQDSAMDTGKKMGLGLAGSFLGGKAGRGLQLYSADFGLFLQRLEFSPCDIAVKLDSGVANVAHSVLTGTAKSAGLQAAFEGALDVVRNGFSPQLSVWLTGLPAKTQQALRIDQLNVADKQKILAEFQQCKFTPAVLKGTFDKPDINESAILRAFNDLDDQITAMLASEMGPKAPGQTQPAQAGTTPPPAKKEEKKGLDGILDIFKKQ